LLRQFAIRRFGTFALVRCLTFAAYRVVEVQQGGFEMKINFMIAGAVVVMAMTTAGSSVAENACGLNDQQIAAGWTCMPVVDVENVSREIGGGSRCQDATITTTSYFAYNPAGNPVEDKSSIGDPVQSEWGSSYNNTGGCNY
jgi:hypothetical protein